jgi:paraquat-inducible protein B
MSKRANPTLIGAFVVGAIALAVAVVLLLAGGELFARKAQYVMYFAGSVKGLNIGSPVTFRGVRIGTVTNIQLVVVKHNKEIKIPVVIEIDNTRFTQRDPGAAAVPDSDAATDMKELIKAGLRAQLQLQSLLTGQLFIQIDFYPGTPDRLVGNEQYVEIPTIPTPIDKISRKLEDFPFDKVLDDITTTMNGIGHLVNSRELQTTLVSIQQSLDEFRKLAGNLNQQVVPLATGVDTTLEEARNALAAARSAMVQARSTLESAGDLVSDQRLITELDNALVELTGAARAVRVLANSIDRQPESLIRGRTK